MHHPEFGLREAAMRTAVQQGKYEFVVPCLKSQDARMRHLGTIAIAGMFKGRPIPDSELTPEMFDLLGRMIENKDESWWVVQDAINALARAPKDVIAENRDPLLERLETGSPWIQMAAAVTLAKISAEPDHYKIVLPRIVKASSNFTNDAASSRSSSAIREALASASSEVKKFAKPLVSETYLTIPDELLGHHGAVLTSGADIVRSRIGSIIQALPDGNEFLLSLPKITYESAVSGDTKDEFVHDGFKSNRDIVGKWLYLSGSWEHPLDDKHIKKAAESLEQLIERQKNATGRNRYRPSYLVLKDDGAIDRESDKVWSGNMLIKFNEGEACKMIVQKVDGDEFLLIERGGFEESVEKGKHPGYLIYRKED